MQAESKKRKAGSGGGSTAWFPSARIVKGLQYADAPHVSIALFYQYISPLWSEARKRDCLSFVEQFCQEHNIGGRVRVGQEGMNATVSGLSDDLRAFTAALGGFDQHFLKTDFKFMDNLPVDRAFGELKVRGLAMWRKVPAG
jgi:predicted sulfurtransferase